MCDERRMRLATLIQESSSLLYSSQQVAVATQQLADQLNRDFAESFPLVLSVMGGAVVFTGHLLPLLRFVLDFDYVHVSRYGDELIGGVIQWRREPLLDVAGRLVLIVDDILDRGYTIAAIRERLAMKFARDVKVVTLCNKKLECRKKVAHADYTGLEVPDCFVYGYGMDVVGFWRNLPEIRALPTDWDLSMYANG